MPLRQLRREAGGVHVRTFQSFDSVTLSKPVPAHLWGTQVNLDFACVMLMEDLFAVTKDYDHPALAVLTFLANLVVANLFFVFRNFRNPVDVIFLHLACRVPQRQQEQK